MMLKKIANYNFVIGLLGIIWIILGFAWEGTCVNGDCTSESFISTGFVLGLISLITWMVLHVLSINQTKNNKGDTK